jgi:GntR family transcriptional repressor for pyruvate dehydrogenase complex
LIPKIVEDIRDKIIRGELKEGQKLPSQDKLALSMEVSRVSLREALNQLVLMGIIEMKQGSGTYIRSITPSSFMQSLSPALLMDKASTMDLLDARLLIEGALAYMAARKATRREIKELKKVLDEMNENLKAGNKEEFSKRDVQFHLLIAEASKNRVLLKVIQTIRDILYEFIAGVFSVIPATARTAMTYHTKIYKAIESHDAAEAKRQMESHIRDLIRRVRNSIAEEMQPVINMGKGDYEAPRVSS